MPADSAGGTEEPLDAARGNARLFGNLTFLQVVIGYLVGREVPPAPPATERLPITWHIVHASIELVSATMHIRRLLPGS